MFCFFTLQKYKYYDKRQVSYEKNHVINMDFQSVPMWFSFRRGAFSKYFLHFCCRNYLR